MHSMVERGELAGIADKRGESDLRREEVVSLLAQLPPASRKVLALYYHENMQCLI
jgi:DNA-directed RNA polymerase specialized sigma24 family protein